MLVYAVLFFVMALAAALFAFTGIASSVSEVAQILFVVFLVLALAGLAVRLWRRGP